MRRALFLILCLPCFAFAAEELRYEGFTDREIHEMELVLQEFTNGEIQYISGAKKGCSCEEGASCTYQVKVVTRKNNESSTWPLSHIEGKWQIGRYFRWQRQYDAFLKELNEAKLKPATFRQEFYKANKSKYEAFMASKPQCSEAAPNNSFKADSKPLRGSERP
jgi:hypothetical protein